MSGLAVSIKEAGGMLDGYEPSISVDSLSNPMLGIINKCCRHWVFWHISVALLWCTYENVLSQHPHLLFFGLYPVPIMSVSKSLSPFILRTDAQPL